jgi:hypothetical protein
MLGPIVLGNSPRPAPYSEYLVTGTVSRQNGASPQNAVVSLVGKWNNFGDSVIDLRGSAIQYQSVKSSGVTDQNGNFTLDVEMEMKLDSIAIRVGALDRPTYITAFQPLPSTNGEILKEDAAQMTGCRGCETVTPAQTYVAAYTYTITVRAILPY